ncbi:MAG: PTS fructose transporter subunit IIA [Gammaproteobacteria bacterium]|nr:PTS fructose transporter subunit IIA [Gammaproteobacteria bacterium]
MSVNILIITHNLIGQELIATATSILGNNALDIHALSIPANLEPEQIGSYADTIRNSIVELNSAQGVLILTDVYGATPNNLARYFAAGLKAEVVSGINLPMLLRILNYNGQKLDQLVTTAVEGAIKGIIRSQ